mgnify:CR=1 FL=1|jgi:antitoxin component HigA of HigAB toxin-antitoxin module
MISNFEKAVSVIVMEKLRSKGITQSELDSKMGFEGSYVGQILSYKRAFNLEHINKLAKIFNCSPKELIPENYIE